MEKKCIVVGYDSSETSKNALKYAVDLAAHMDRNVVAVHVLENADVRTEKEQVLKLALQSVDNPSDVSMDYRVIEGNAKEDLSKIAEALKAELIVLGTNRSNLWENFFGSSTMRTVKNSEVPYILVNPFVEFSPVDKIGVIIDSEKESAQIVKATANLAKALGAEIHLIGTHYQDASYTQSADHNMKVAQKYLAQLGMEGKGVFTQDEEFIFYITEYCKDQGIDMVACTYRSGNFEIFSDRFVERLSEQAAGIPVLTRESEEIGTGSPFYFMQ